jgi:hypothetical protein
MPKTVGRFSIDGTRISGPAEYMRERGDARLHKLLAGQDALFNACAHWSPDTETAILVWLQTDFAAWLGMRDLRRHITDD